MSCAMHYISCIAHTHRCMYGDLLDWLLGGGSDSPQWLSVNHIRTTETLSLMDPTNTRVSVFSSSDSLLCPQSCNRHLSLLPVRVLLVDNSWEKLLLDRPAR